MLPAGGHRTHEHPMRAQAVHADAVAEQGAAGAPPGRVDGEDGDPLARNGVRRGLDEPVQQFVGDAALAGAACSGKPHDRHAGAGELPLLAQPAQFGFRHVAALDRRKEPGQVAVALSVRPHPRPEARFGRGPPLGVRALHDVVDHRRQAHLQAVVGVVDPLDAVGLELRDLLRRDRAAAAAEHENVLPALLRQPVDHVAEELDVPALVGTDRDRVGVFLHGGADDLVDAAVVAQVDHLGAAVLDHPPHDVDRRVVTVEERGGGHEPQRTGVLGGAGSRILFGRGHGDGVAVGLSCRGARLPVPGEHACRSLPPVPSRPSPGAPPSPTGCAGAPAGFGEKRARRQPRSLSTGCAGALAGLRKGARGVSLAPRSVRRAARL